jgi:hypothetical protein
MAAEDDTQETTELRPPTRPLLYSPPLRGGVITK